VCDVEVALESQLVQHIGQHKSCPEPGCTFSAASRMMNEHVESVHGRVSKPSREVSSTVSFAEVLAGTVNASEISFGRCDVCDTDFRMPSQSALHAKQHVSCPEPGCEFSAIKRVVTKHVETAHSEVRKLAEEVNGAGESVSRQDLGYGRCDVCDTDFRVVHQQALHAKQHVVCPHPGCEFSAIKRVVTKHVEDVHGCEQECPVEKDDTTSNSSSGPTENDREVVLDGR
ncbi:hypothetical protein Gpo141_00015066, partial [Globisporangium polare]